MSWMLTASGQPEPGAPVAEARDLEHRLVAELKAVLSKPEYGAVSSWFRGIHVASSAVHHQPETPEQPEQPKPAAAEQAPEPAAKPKPPGRPGKSAASA